MFILLLIMLFQPLHCQSVLTQQVLVTAYEGDTVTLPSGVNNRNLTIIQWSIFQNMTYITTWRVDGHGDIKSDLFWSYKDRLNLNTITGDLLIKNVEKRDAISYSVFLMDTNDDQYDYTIQLNVRARLPEPSLSVNMSLLDRGRCVVELHCTSPQEGLNISWAYLGSSPVPFAFRRLGRNSYVLWANLPANISGNFSCTISDGLRNSSESILASCKDKHGGDQVIPVKHTVRHFYCTLSLLCLNFGLVTGIYYGLRLASSGNKARNSDTKAQQEG